LLNDIDNYLKVYGTDNFSFWLAVVIYRSIWLIYYSWPKPRASVPGS